MFLKNLNEQEKKAFLKIVENAAKCNNEIALAETKLIEEYANEMELSSGISDYSFEESVLLLSKSDMSIKKIAVLELLGLMYADGEYDSLEKDFVLEFTNAIDVSKDDLEYINELLEQYLRILGIISDAIFKSN